MMLDWLTFWDQLIYWVQVLTTAVLAGLLVLAFLSWITRNRKWTIDCLMIAVVLLIAGAIAGQFGIRIFAPQLYELIDWIFSWFQK